MTSARILFGLSLAACAATPPQPAAPLCDHDGAPACGNIGQVGRPYGAPPATVIVVAPVTEAASQIMTVPMRRNLLSPPTSIEGHAISVGRPLANADREYAPGNVMGKRSE